VDAPLISKIIIVIATFCSAVGFSFSISKLLGWYDPYKMQMALSLQLVMNLVCWVSYLYPVTSSGLRGVAVSTIVVNGIFLVFDLYIVSRSDNVYRTVHPFWEEFYHRGVFTVKPRFV